MKYYLFIITFLGLRFHCLANDQDPFGEEAENAPRLAINPERGYLGMVPYVKTPLSIVSIHSPTLVNPPSSLLEMPRLGQVDSTLPHTKPSDELYDITKWFPLDEMRAANDKEADDERFVYYNKTSGYVITYADHFLQASVYDYIDGSIRQDGYRVKLDMIYVEIEDKVSLDLESIQQAAHKVIFRTTGVARMYEKTELNVGNEFIETTVMDANGRKAFYLMINYFVDGYGTVINTDLSFPVSEWVIFECGISEAGSRKVMMVKADYVDFSGQVLHLESSREDFIKSKFPVSEDDPFGENVTEYYRLHPVPPDIVNLLPDSEPGTDGNPFATEFKDQDITELVRNQGVKAKVYALPSAGYVVAYGDQQAHEMLEELFSFMGGGDRPLALTYDLNFYEIDASSNPQKESWDVEDLLAGNPKKLASVGLVAISGSRSEQYSGESYCKVELIRGEWEPEMRASIDYYLKFKMNTPLLKFEKEYEGVIQTNKPKVVSLGINTKTNRMRMMLTRCREIDPSMNTWGQN